MAMAQRVALVVLCEYVRIDDMCTCIWRGVATLLVLILTVY